MPKCQPHDESTRTLVKRFSNYVFDLKLLYYSFCELFEDASTQPLMERTAQMFFNDLNNILANYFLLEVAKLTDPSTSKVGKDITRENFTLANLIETVEWPFDCLQQINELNKIVMLFRKHIKVARHRLLAHYDKETVILGTSLGGFLVGEDKKLLEALEQMCNLFHIAAFGEILGEMVPYHSGDVLDLKKALKRAIKVDP